MCVTIDLLSSEAERRAHNPEVGGSKPPGGTLYFVNRHGAGAARGAHNSEVTRSKRVAGIFSIWQF